MREMRTIEAVGCWECGAPAAEWHHVVPASLGGRRTVPLCAACHALADGRGVPTAGETRHQALMRAGLERRLARGMDVGSLPYGLRLMAGGVWEPDPQEAPVLAQMRAWRQDGVSYRAIAARLNAAGFRTRVGTPWRTVSVRRHVLDGQVVRASGGGGRPRRARALAGQLRLVGMD